MLCKFDAKLPVLKPVFTLIYIHTLVLFTYDAVKCLHSRLLLRRGALQTRGGGKNTKSIWKKQERRGHFLIGFILTVKIQKHEGPQYWSLLTGFRHFYFFNSVDLFYTCRWLQLCLNGANLIIFYYPVSQKDFTMQLTCSTYTQKRPVQRGAEWGNIVKKKFWRRIQNRLERMEKWQDTFH